MNKLLITITLLVMAHNVHADYNYAELGVGSNVNVFGCTAFCWEDQNVAGALLAVGHRWETKRYYTDLHWTHLSQWMAGFPVNGKDESSVDHIGFKFGVKF